MPQHVTVSAPSRLHFGLFAFGGSGRQFGGVGAMIDQPRLELAIQPANELQVTGPLAERGHAFALRWAQSHSDLPPPRCRLEILAAPPEHAGLGVGTQLGLSIAAGLNAYYGLAAAGPLELASSVGRGLRSAVGTYGFLLGGLIAERGKLPHEPLSPLDLRIDMPREWRFVLFQPPAAPGLAGREEEQAISSLPPVPPEVTQALVSIAQDELFPAAAQANFVTFSDSLYRYGELAGQCYAARQGGPFNGPLLSQLVHTLRALGVVGVGQSSWGPTIFALCESLASAEDVIRRFERAWHSPASVACRIAAPANRGAEVVAQG
jgi:beta-RFAP synthase